VTRREAIRRIMQQPTMAILGGLLLAVSSHFTGAAAATLTDVRKALGSPAPVVLIGVPADFLGGDGDSDPCVVSDWQYYLDNWIESSAKQKNLKVIIVSLKVLAEALRTPALKAGRCAALFVKNKTEGLLNNRDDSCVLMSRQYDVGAKWLKGIVSQQEIAENGYQTTAVVARMRN
jgi:hypothetical protein